MEHHKLTDDEDQEIRYADLDRPIRTLARDGSGTTRETIEKRISGLKAQKRLARTARDRVRIAAETQDAEAYLMKNFL